MEGTQEGEVYDRLAERLHPEIKQRIRAAGLNPAPVLAELCFWTENEEANSIALGILRYWARCLRREVPVTDGRTTHAGDS